MKMRKLQMVAVLLPLLAMRTFAATETVDGIEWTYTIVNGKASVDGGSSSPAVPTSTKGAIVIPSTLGNRPVTSIGWGAFEYCSGLTSITIPSSVTSIGDWAFGYCSGLTGALTIPSSVTSIGNYAFYVCGGLTAVTISKGVKSIGMSAFGYCSGLTSVTIPEGVTSIGYGAFERCSGLTGALTIPSSVTSIGEYAFSNCRGLTSVEIPSSVKSIGGCVFRDCRGLMSVTIPSSVTSIGQYAFEYCSGLTSLTIPSSVTSIGGYAFRGCSGLTTVTIPSSVTSIGGYAFRGCSGLTSIAVDAANAYYCSVDGMLLDKAKTTLITCPGGKQDAVTIPSSVTSIGEYAFEYCSGLTSVTISEGVPSIGDRAFSGCSGLTSVTIPSSVTSIGWGAFESCRGLATLTIPSSVTSIGDYAFYDCRGLTSVEIPSSVTSIGGYAFFDCRGLTSVTIQEGMTSIGWGAFEYCSGLTSITIPSSVTSIGDYAFYHCSGLKTVYVDVGDVSRVKEMMSGARASVEQIEFIEVRPLPVLGPDATAEEVRAALAESADGRLAANITDAKTYGKYREWAQRVGELGAAQSANAWISFAVDSPVLLARAPTDDELTITGFEPTGTAGTFAFEVAVAGVEIGAGADAANLKKAFGLTGAATLDLAKFDEGNVAIKFGEPVDGKLRFTATAADTKADSFFMRMRVK